MPPIVIPRRAKKTPTPFQQAISPQGTRTPVSYGGPVQQAAVPTLPQAGVAPPSFATAQPPAAPPPMAYQGAPYPQTNERMEVPPPPQRTTYGGIFGGGDLPRPGVGRNPWLPQPGLEQFKANQQHAQIPAPQQLDVPAEMQRHAGFPNVDYSGGANPDFQQPAAPTPPAATPLMRQPPPKSTYTPSTLTPEQTTPIYGPERAGALRQATPATSNIAPRQMTPTYGPAAGYGTAANPTPVPSPTPAPPAARPPASLAPPTPPAQDPRLFGSNTPEMLRQSQQQYGGMFPGGGNTAGGPAPRAPVEPGQDPRLFGTNTQAMLDESKRLYGGMYGGGVQPWELGQGQQPAPSANDAAAQRSAFDAGAAAPSRYEQYAQANPGGLFSKIPGQYTYGQGGMPVQQSLYDQVQQIRGIGQQPHQAVTPQERQDMLRANAYGGGRLPSEALAPVGTPNKDEQGTVGSFRTPLGPGFAGVKGNLNTQQYYQDPSGVQRVSPKITMPTDAQLAAVNPQAVAAPMTPLTDAMKRGTALADRRYQKDRGMVGYHGPSSNPDGTPAPAGPSAEFTNAANTRSQGRIAQYIANDEQRAEGQKTAFQNAMDEGFRRKERLQQRKEGPTLVDYAIRGNRNAGELLRLQAIQNTERDRLAAAGQESEADRSLRKTQITNEDTRAKESNDLLRERTRLEAIHEATKNGMTPEEANAAYPASAPGGTAVVPNQTPVASPQVVQSQYAKATGSTRPLIDDFDTAANTSWSHQGDIKGLVGFLQDLELKGAATPAAKDLMKKRLQQKFPRIWGDISGPRQPFRNKQAAQNEERLRKFFGTG